MDVCVRDEYWTQTGGDECTDKAAVCRVLLRLVDRVMCNAYGICLLITRFGPHDSLRDVQLKQGGVAGDDWARDAGSLVQLACSSLKV
jgi:hypothetical protein